METMLITGATAASSTITVTPGRPHVLRWTDSGITAGTLIVRDVTTNRPNFDRSGTAISFDLSSVSAGGVEFVPFVTGVQLSLTSGTGTGSISYECAPVED